MKRSRPTWLVATAAILLGQLAAVPGRAAAEDAAPNLIHEQQPSSLFVHGPGFDLGDGSVLFVQENESIRYWPASGKIIESPLPVNLSYTKTVQNTPAGLVVAGGNRTEEEVFTVGDGTVLLIRPDGTVLSAQMSVPRFNARSVMLTDGSVLVVGGVIRETNSRTVELEKQSARTTAAELISYRDGKLKVTRVPDMPGEPRRGFRLVALKDGRVMALGGTPAWYNACMGCIADTWLFDPKTRQWQLGPPMKVPRTDFSATLLDDGRVLVAGGWSPRSSDPDDRVEVYDPRTEQWEEFPALPAPVVGHQAVWLAGEEGRTLLFGGGTNPQIQALDVANRRWLTVGEMQRYRIGAEMLSYRDAAGSPWVQLFGGVYFPRGQNPFPDFTVERIPLRNRQIEGSKSGIFQLQRGGVALAIRPDGFVLLASGGVDGDPGSVSTASVDLLAPNRSIPVAMPTLNHARTGADAFWLPQGEAVVIGGTVSSYNRQDVVDPPAEWYDPRAQRWMDLMNAGDGKPFSAWHSAVYGQFADGSLLEVSGSTVNRVLIVGGQARRESLPALARGRYGNYMAKALSDGRIVVAGGSVEADVIAVTYESSESDSTDDGEASPEPEEYAPDEYRGYGPILPSRRHEIFDPATGQWRSSAPARVAGEKAVILDDGRVVKVGETNPGRYEGEQWIPAIILMEISSPDGTRWQNLPLPEKLVPDVSDIRFISQAGELFMEGRREPDHHVALWWFDESRKGWKQLAEWDYNSAYFGKLVTATTPNGKRLVRVWP